MSLWNFKSTGYIWLVYKPERESGKSHSRDSHSVQISQHQPWKLGCSWELPSEFWKRMDCPGVPGVKNLPATAGDTGSIPSLEIPCASGATKPEHHSYWSPHTVELMLHKKRGRAQHRRPSIAKNKVINLKNCFNIFKKFQRIFFFPT